MTHPVAPKSEDRYDGRDDEYEDYDDEPPCSHCGGSGQCPCEMCWFHPACSYCGGLSW